MIVVAGWHNERREDLTNLRAIRRMVGRLVLYPNLIGSSGFFAELNLKNEI